jgi:hypothetical protein
MNDGGDDDLVPGKPGFERALAQGQFEFAKTRYARTLTGESVRGIIEAAARDRAKLVEEITNLQIVTRDRYAAATAAKLNYASILPHRVGKTSIQPPTALERIGEHFGSMRLYKLALKQSKEFTEAQDLLAKKRIALNNLERRLRERLDSQENIVLQNLQTPQGLKLALRRDPLLNQAYEHLRAFANGPDGESDAFVPHRLDDLPAVAPISGYAAQFPDEPA